MEIENFNGKTRNVMRRTVLDQFLHLTNPQGKVRIKSSLNILKYLNNENEESELNYSLTRIIRSLGASTSDARTGYYTILVALLNVANISLDHIFKLVDKELHTAGRNAKSENADILTGQILVCGAIIHSNLWLNTTKHDKIKITNTMLNACIKRTYLGLLAYEFIIDSFEKVSDKEFYEICPLLKEDISKPLEDYDLNSLYLLLHMKKKFPNVPKNVKSIVKYHNIFSEENLPKLCNILMIIPKLTSLQHPVYNIIGTELATSEILNIFFEDIDKYLEISNRNKLLAIVKLYTTILEKLQDPSYIPSLLTKNFIHQTLNHFKTLKGKDQDVEFKQSINIFFENLVDAVKPESIPFKIKISVLKKLLFSPGTFIFEKITRSKVIQNITWSLNTEGVKKLGEVYAGVINGTEKVESQYGHGDYWLNNDKLYAAHLLIKLINHKVLKENKQWKIDQLIFLMDLGILKDSQVHIGNELGASLKIAFYGALDMKLSKLEELHTILSKVVLYLDSKINQNNLETILRTPITNEEYLIWEKTIATIKKLENKKKKTGLKSVFLTLFLYLSLLLFNDPKLSTDSLNELFVCYEETRKHRKDSDTINETEIKEKSEDFLWIEVVTDLFLNFLSQNSSLLRTIVNLVFPYLCKYMTPNTIHQLISVLDPENENPLSKGNTESAEENSDDNSDFDEEDDEEDDQEDELDEDENETVNDKLRMAIHKVLNSNGNQSDEESIDIEQLSETEGEKLDSALAEAFKQFRPNHGKLKKQNEDQKTLTHFRVRVLDLIEIYLDRSPSMILTLEIMLPLLKTVEFSIRDEHQIPLLNRLKSCLKKLSNLRKFGDIEGVDDRILTDLLQNLLDKGTKSNWIIQDMAEQISDCCIYIIKCSDLLANTESTPKKVRKRLKNAITDIIQCELETFFIQRESLTPILLFKKIEQLSWDGNLSLITLILKFIFNDNIKIFKKTQAAELAVLFYTNQRYLSTKIEEIREALNAHHEEFSNNVLTMFKNFCDNTKSKDISEKFLCHIFKLLTAMKSCVLNIDRIQWPEIANIIREYKSTISLSKDAKSAFNKLCDRLNVSNIVKMKQKVISLKRIEHHDKNLINRNKKNKGKLKLKKESKERRLQSLSEGFKISDFAAAEEVEMVENESNEETIKKNSKKRKDSEMNGGAETDLQIISKKKKKKNTEPELLNGVS